MYRCANKSKPLGLTVKPVQTTKNCAAPSDSHRRLHLLAEGCGVHAELIAHQRPAFMHKLSIYPFARTILPQTRPDNQIIGSPIALICGAN